MIYINWKMFEYKFEYEIKMKLCNENKTNYKKNNSKNRLAILQHFSFLVLFKNISPVICDLRFEPARYDIYMIYKSVYYRNNII